MSSEEYQRKKAELKNFRRSAKAAFTRCANALDGYLQAKRTTAEIEDLFNNLEVKFQKVESAHENYCLLVEDEEFNAEENWMATVEDSFHKLKLKVNDASGNQIKSEKMTQHAAQESQDQQQLSTITQMHTEKIPLPVFDGKIENYLRFRCDWRKIVEARYGKSDDTLYLLNRKISDDARNWIAGKTTYAEAWAILDEVYGDARLVSDSLIAEIEKFKPLSDENDPRLVSLYHLVQKTLNVLQEHNRKADLDNSTTLGIVERKLCATNRMKWAEYQREKKIEPSISTILKWLSDRIWIRRTAQSDIRNRTSSKKADSILSASEAQSDDISKPEQKLAEQDESPKPLKPKVCWYCERSDHQVSNCTSFNALTPNQRLEATNGKSACYFCLRKHRFPCMAKKKPCTEKNNGAPCPYYHHPLLHGADFKKRELSTYIGSGQKLLPIVSQKVTNLLQNTWQMGNILLDSGSDFCLIRNGFAHKLGLNGEQDQLNFTVASGQTVSKPCMSYTVHISGRNGTMHEVKAKGIDKITDDALPVDMKPVAEKFGINEKEITRKGGPIDILLGIDYVEFQAGTTITIDNLAFRDTCIGPVIYGVSSQQNVSRTGKLNSIMERFNLEKFWSTESMGVVIDCKEYTNSESKQTSYRKLLPPKDKKLVNNLRERAENKDSRWTIPVPWKKNPNHLPNNYGQAKAKLINTEKRLLKSPEQAEVYNQQITDLVCAKSARKLTKQELSTHVGPVHYISHHAVLRPDKPTHPCRVVFNLSASYKGHRLNDYIHQCGDHLNDLLGVLLRWRENHIPIVGDISKMFHQIQMDPESSHTHRFLWRNFDQTREPDIYVKQVWTFGNVASPAIANLAVDLTAERYASQYPEAAQSILNQRYMDDIAESLPNEKSAEERIHQINEILATGHFRIKSWSSSTQFLDIADHTESEKILGAKWHKSSDSLSINITHTTAPTSCEVMTKRTVLSMMSTAFDVFGLGSPVLISGKILMQELWVRKLGWDDILPNDLMVKWTRWFEEFNSLPQIKIKRCITPVGAVGCPELITFSDASTLAIGSVCYIRWLLEDGTYEVNFLLAKSRVTPLRQLSLARLELQSAVMAARLTDVIKKQMRLKFRSITHFTDSMIVLGWIQNENRTDPVFIANRTGEIQMKTAVKDWKHIPGQYNVADDISRGLKTSELNKRYIPGPEFLHLPEDQWPVSSTNTAEFIEEQEVVLAVKLNNTFPKFDIEKLSLYRPLMKVLRIVATIIRFFHILQTRIVLKKQGETGTHSQLTQNRKSEHIDVLPLTADELLSAKYKLIIMAQSHLEADYQNAYSTLTPFVKDGIIRVGGRVDASQCSYDEKHPILLPKNHWLSKLIIEHVHQFGHPGVAATTARVRTSYWIINVKKQAKAIVFQCLFCREMGAKFESQFMASLPTFRLTPSPPFYNCACDLFGPYSIKISRNKAQKYWGVLFTCLSTRSLYGDVTADYSAREFLQTFRRFITIRGFPSSVMSDNGSQLVSAAKDIINWSSTHEINWYFTTPTAAHQNGCVESLVKSVKKAMASTMKNVTTLTALEFQTLVFEAVNLVNERPIGLLPTDPNDGSYICPNDILLGRSGIRVPPGPFEEADTRRRVEFVQSLVRAFWLKWQRDVFPTLLPRQKWSINQRDVKVDDYVLLSDPIPEHGKWTKGRITQVFPGKDGKVRNVRVKTVTNEYERPVTKLVVLLPVEEQS